MEPDIKVLPFSVRTGCPKCGNNTNTSPATGGFPGPVFSEAPLADFFLVRYCSGGKEPEEPQESEPVVRAIAQIAGGAMRGALPGPKINICAGVLTEHLHKTCFRCGYELLTECQDRAEAHVG